MANQVVQLYDADSNAIDPKSNAEAILGGIVIPNQSSVKDDLESLLRQIQEIRRQITGAAQIENDLHVKVTYNTNIYNNPNDVKSLQFSEQFQLPTSEAAYTWKKTQYLWGQDNIGDPIYEIVATALYPETQVMYASIGAGHTQTNLLGPSDFSSNDNGVRDRGDINVTWYYYFPGIDASKTQGYMAVRHRDAGKVFPNNGAWKISLMAQFPTQS